VCWKKVLVKSSIILVFLAGIRLCKFEQNFCYLNCISECINRFMRDEKPLKHSKYTNLITQIYKSNHSSPNFGDKIKLELFKLRLRFDLPHDRNHQITCGRSQTPHPFLRFLSLPWRHPPSPCPLSRSADATSELGQPINCITIRATLPCRRLYNFVPPQKQFKVQTAFKLCRCRLADSPVSSAPP
jgi:hypothetical protein